jgi:SagB-type dehydrogenase family enzyme
MRVAESVPDSAPPGLTEDLLSVRLRLSPVVRLVLPEAPGNSSWVITDLLRNKEYRAGRHAIALCVAASSPLTGGCLLTTVASQANVQPARLEEVLATLVTRQVLIRADGFGGQPPAWAEELLVRWRDYGWTEAADHHLAAFGYPFLDYSADAWDQDRARMRAYRHAEPDTLRLKQVRAGAPRASGPTSAAALATLDTPADDCLADVTCPATLDNERLLIMLAAVFGVRATVPSASANAVPAIRRTSPSGGSRHPSEGYLCAFSVPGVPPGWHHFASAGNELVHVADLDEPAARAALYGPIRRAAFVVQAVIIITSQFERNMYRYREPRTFRTIFMDAGHLVATTELTCTALALRSLPHHGMDEAYIEAVLGLDALQEGVITGIAIGSSA